LRSPTTLLVFLACLVIAGFLLYTYLSSESGVEASDKGTELSPADADLLDDPGTGSDAAATEEPAEPPAAESIDDGAVPETEPAASPSPRPAPQPAPRPEPPRAAAPEAQPEVADRPEASPPDKSEAEAEADAADTVQAFYSALSAGDGASAARFVIPAKRGSGPLSAGALTRYYSSFRRPLRLRRVVPVNADTVRVAYDYVLADGRVCRGQAAVDVVHRGGRSLVSGIRTRGPC
jgi:outer membrane biosynthesis protein TonB